MSVSPTRGMWLLFAVAAMVPSRASTQVPIEPLGRPDAAFPEPFSAIAGVHELSDGRVVLADRLEKAVRILDLDAGTFVDVGRTGGGPGEYEMPGRLLPLPGDSTLLVDFANMRLSTITADGRIVGSTSMQHPSGMFVMPEAVDAAGRVYFRQTSFSAGSGGSLIPDSLPILRWDRRGDSFEPVAQVPVPELRVMRAGSGGSVRSSGGIAPYPAGDAWAVAPDGRVALVRIDPYRVEWIGDDGRERRGPVVPFTPVRVTDEDKRAWEERPSGQGVMIAIGSSGGSANRSRSMTIPQPSAAEVEWPDVKPAFPAGGARTTPDGEVWVRRYVRHDEPTRFDVFDAEGRRVRQVELPAERRLIGFGPQSVYVAYEDADGLQWLERYAR